MHLEVSPKVSDSRSMINHILQYRPQDILLLLSRALNEKFPGFGKFDCKASLENIYSYSSEIGKEITLFVLHEINADLTEYFNDTAFSSYTSTLIDMQEYIDIVITQRLRQYYTHNASIAKI